MNTPAMARPFQDQYFGTNSLYNSASTPPSLNVCSWRNVTKIYVAAKASTAFPRVAWRMFDRRSCFSEVNARHQGVLLPFNHCSKGRSVCPLMSVGRKASGLAYRLSS